MELRMHRQTDWNALMRAVLLLALTALVARLVLTGQITGYIHPKFIWFTASGAAGLALMAAGQLRRGLRGVTGYVAPMPTGLYVTLIAMLCVGFLVRPHTFGADLAAKQGMNMTNRAGAPGGSLAGKSLTSAPAADAEIIVLSSPTSQEVGGANTASGPGAAPPAATQPVQSSTAPTPAQPPPVPLAAASPPSAPVEQAAPLPVAAGVVALTGNTAVIITQNFVHWMTEMYGRPDDFVGKRAVLEGFVFYPPDAGPDQFAVTRLVVSCHVAHAYPDGLLSVLPGKARPEQDTWHRAEGVLESAVYNGTKVLRLRIDKLIAIGAPADPYVYP